MKPMIDRNQPVDYEYRGVIATIAFQWGLGHDPIPTGLKISIVHKDSPVLRLREKARYDSYDESVEVGKKLAEAEIDRILGPK